MKVNGGRALLRLCDDRRVPTPSFTPHSCVLATLANVSRSEERVFPSGNLWGLARMISVSAFHAAPFD